MVGLLLISAFVSGTAPSDVAAEQQDPMMQSGPMQEKKEKEADRERADSPAVSPDPGISIDRLLQLPTGMEFGRTERSGDSSSQWRKRFRERQRAVDEAQAEVDRVKAELDELAGGGSGSQWQVAPPGSNSSQIVPMSLKLREEMRHQREVLTGAKRKLRELHIEADLADVPPEWRTVAQR